MATDIRVTDSGYFHVGDTAWTSGQGLRIVATATGALTVRPLTRRERLWLWTLRTSRAAMRRIRG